MWLTITTHFQLTYNNHTLHPLSKSHTKYDKGLNSYRPAVVMFALVISEPQIIIPLLVSLLKAMKALYPPAVAPLYRIISLPKSVVMNHPNPM
jgi:hypothetical protein